jgi:hypothetical protein
MLGPYASARVALAVTADSLLVGSSCVRLCPDGLAPTAIPSMSADSAVTDCLIVHLELRMTKALQCGDHTCATNSAETAQLVPNFAVVESRSESASEGILHLPRRYVSAFPIRHCTAGAQIERSFRSENSVVCPRMATW